MYINSDEDAGDAKAFSATETYAAGDIVIYDGGLYRFTAAHAAGAWTGTDADEIGEASDTDFLKLNDGWIKQISKGGHVLDASSSGLMTLDTMYDAMQLLPNKYNNGKLRWLMSPKRAQDWQRYLYNQIIGHGGAVPESVYNSPAGIPSVACPSLGNDNVLLTDPKNLIVVNTYSVQIRKTTEGKEAIMQDKRFYVVHLDFDPIIEELDATAIIKGLK